MITFEELFLLSDCGLSSSTTLQLIAIRSIFKIAASQPTEDERVFCRQYLQERLKVLTASALYTENRLRTAKLNAVYHEQ